MPAPTYVTVYLDVDTDGDDLLDSAGNRIAAGWYRCAWPLNGADPEGPFISEFAARDADYGEE
jgi:hypothetical protein